MSKLRVHICPGLMARRSAGACGVLINRHRAGRRDANGEDGPALPAVAQHLSVVSLGHRPYYGQPQARALRPRREEGFEEPALRFLVDSLPVVRHCEAGVVESSPGRKLHPAAVLARLYRVLDEV